MKKINWASVIRKTTFIRTGGNNDFKRGGIFQQNIYPGRLQFSEFKRFPTGFNNVRRACLFKDLIDKKIEI